MSIYSLVAFMAAAALLTITPGLDTALVLRTAATEGRRSAAAAATGIVTGVQIWGVLVAVGLGVVVTASATAFAALKWIGAAYLVYLGFRLLLRPRDAYELAGGDPERRRDGWFLRGLLSNLLNPKVGAFYVSFLPQFIAAGADVRAWSILLATIHAAISVAWFAVLIAAATSLVRTVRRPGVLRWLDRAVGTVFVGFGVRLGLASR
jgi:RhtB (resistance to homoserine/threonine) family protein